MFLVVQHREDKNSLRSGNYPLLSMRHGFHGAAIKPLGQKFVGKFGAKFILTTFWKIQV